MSFSQSLKDTGLSELWQKLPRDPSFVDPAAVMELCNCFAKTNETLFG